MMIVRFDKSKVMITSQYDKDHIWLGVEDVDGGTCKRPYGVVNLEELEAMRDMINKNIGDLKEKQGEFLYTFETEEPELMKYNGKRVVHVEKMTDRGELVRATLDSGERIIAKNGELI